MKCAAPAFWKGSRIVGPYSACSSHGFTWVSLVWMSSRLHSSLIPGRSGLNNIGLYTNLLSFRSSFLFFLSFFLFFFFHLHIQSVQIVIRVFSAGSLDWKTILGLLCCRLDFKADRFPSGPMCCVNSDHLLQMEAGDQISIVLLARQPFVPWPHAERVAQTAHRCLLVVFPSNQPSLSL
ncbi:hypothetical protein VTI28DRAFT_8870 [Corynascus sepedonium]